MHPHDPDRAVAAQVGRDAGARLFTMPVERRSRGPLFVVIGLVAIGGLIGQSVYRRWRWTASGTARIEVTVSPTDATIALDGWPAQRAPAALLVQAGSHTLVVERDGYARVEQVIELGAGEAVEVPVTLVMVPAAPPIARPAPPRPVASRPLRATTPHPPRSDHVLYVDMKSGAIR